MSSIRGGVCERRHPIQTLRSGRTYALAGIRVIDLFLKAQLDRPKMGRAGQLHTLKNPKPKPDVDKRRTSVCLPCCFGNTTTVLLCWYLQTDHYSYWNELSNDASIIIHDAISTPHERTHPSQIPNKSLSWSKACTMQAM